MCHDPAACDEAIAYWDALYAADARERQAQREREERRDMMSDERPESQRGTPLSEGSLPLTPERAMRMQRTTQFVMSAVAATPDCPVLFVDVGEGFLSLAHVGDIERLIQETQAPLLAENDRLREQIAALSEKLDAEVDYNAGHIERLRAREVALLAVVRAVAEADNSDNSVCYQVCDYSMHGDWMIEHEAPCVVKQARALLASDSDEAK